MLKTGYQVGGFSAAGPRSTNEDCIGFWRENGWTVAAVADGLGGMGGGAVASHYAIEGIERLVSKGMPADFEVEFERLHHGLQLQQEIGGDLKSMATTLTVACVSSDFKLMFYHCGDTRLLLSRGNGIQRLTRDQTEADRLFSEGLISKSELRDYPRRNILESALGSRSAPTVESGVVAVVAGDVLLLVSDGVYERLSMREILGICRKSGHVSDRVLEIQRAVEDRGPVDNFSAVMIDIL